MISVVVVFGVAEDEINVSSCCCSDDDDDDSTVTSLPPPRGGDDDSSLLTDAGVADEGGRFGLKGVDEEGNGVIAMLVAEAEANIIIGSSSFIDFEDGLERFGAAFEK